MILLHVRTKTLSQAEEITDFLVEEKYILNAAIFEKVKVREKNDETGEMKTHAEYLLTGKTKALLFSKIDEMLRMRYPNNVPTIYALPIAVMDWEQADELVGKTAKV